MTDHLINYGIDNISVSLGDGKQVFEGKELERMIKKLQIFITHFERVRKYGIPSIFLDQMVKNKTEGKIFETLEELIGFVVATLKSCTNGELTKNYNLGNNPEKRSLPFYFRFDKNPDESELKEIKRLNLNAKFKEDKLSGKFINFDKEDSENFIKVDEEFKNIRFVFSKNSGQQYYEFNIRADVMKKHSSVIVNHDTVSSVRFKNLQSIYSTISYMDFPPFFIEEKNNNISLKTKGKFLDFIIGRGKKGLQIQRYKGLGEMNPGQLWDTTMNPATRTLLQVKSDDEVEAEEIFSILMGDAVEPRRNFIQENALEVKNLDV
jgi:DNA gyrase subunit B